MPAGTPGRATFGAKVYSAELTINGVFGTVASGAWISSWVPYNPGVGTANIAGAVVAPAAIAPGAVTLSAKTSGKGATLTGRVTQGGQARARSDGDDLRRLEGDRSQVRGPREGGRERCLRVQGEVGTFFRATCSRDPGPGPGGVRPASAADRTVPCVNPTVNGFTVQSKVVRKKK